jgi:hypothetical protein
VAIDPGEEAALRASLRPGIRLVSVGQIAPEPLVLEQPLTSRQA